MSKQCEDEVRFFVVSGIVYIVKTVCGHKVAYD